MAGKISFDETVAVKLVSRQYELGQAVDKFLKNGLGAVADCGIKGGEQEKKIKTLVEDIEGNMKDISVFIESQATTVEGILKNFGGFNDQDIVRIAKQAAEGIQKTEKTTSNKMKFG